MYKHLFVFAFLFSWVSASGLLAQSRLPFRDPVSWARIDFGGIAMRGDLQTGFNRWDGMAGLSLVLNKSPRLNSSFQVQFGHMSAQNLLLSQPNDPSVEIARFVRTSFFTVNYQLRYSFLKKPKYQVYFGQGLGLLRFIPSDSEGNSLAEQPGTRAEGEAIGNLAAVFPTALGGMYLLRNGFGIQASLQLLNPLTDYLDNLSQLGSRQGNDQALSLQIGLLVPIQFRPEAQRRKGRR